MNSSIVFGSILCIVSIVIMYNYYGFKKGILFFMLLISIGAITVLIPKYFGDTGKYILAGVVIVLALIVNIKSIKDPLVKKMKEIFN
ncbi:MAG: hypothetical protein GY932_05875, partial [Arcobacter sp.]|nr:hypothetical protein [Arcobacter sp.]